MRKIESLEELKKVQLEILLRVHEFCVANNINYSLSCGTLLGAIRHKGYIPWDDDIDIQLLREDYNRLVQKFPDVFNDISLISLERDKRWNRAYARAYNVRTIEVEEAKGVIKGIGVGIDIFPIDKVPEKNDEWIKYNNKRLFLQDLQSIKMLKWKKDRTLWKKITMVIGQLLLLPFSMRYLAEQINRYAQIYNTNKTKYVYENCQGIGKRRNRFLMSDFDEYIDAEFEGYHFKIINGYDDYLTNSYGEYMELPPIGARIPHHTFNAFWK